MRRHLNPSTLIATLALFLALAGGTYAAVKLPKNSVGSRQIKPNAVRGTDVKESSLGEVPNAGNAAHAATADSATTATTATKATDASHATTADTATSAASADKLGGLTADQLKLHCATGTRAKWGGCLELSAHAPQTAVDALEDCSTRGGRLLSWLELRWVASQADIVWADGQSNSYEFTGEVFDPSTKEMLAIDQGGNVLHVAPSGTQRYRCLLAQVNG